MFPLWIKNCTMGMRAFANIQRPNLSAHLLTMTADFSKYISKSRKKRLPLTTKRAGKGFYKGNRGRKEGYITSKGRFIQDKEMLTELVVPDLTNCKLKPYIASGAKRNVRDATVDIQQQLVA